MVKRKRTNRANLHIKVLIIIYITLFGSILSLKSYDLYKHSQDKKLTQLVQDKIKAFSEE